MDALWRVDLIIHVGGAVQIACKVKITMQWGLRIRNTVDIAVYKLAWDINGCELTTITTWNISLFCILGFQTMIWCLDYCFC